jgi:hypothetical protein
MERRTPKLVVNELGSAFVEQHQHTDNHAVRETSILRLMQLLDLAKSVHAGKRDQNDASEDRAGVNSYVAVRLANGKSVV